MDFITLFLNSLNAPPHLTSDLEPAALCGELYKPNPDTAGRLITLYSRGITEAAYPFFYDTKGLDCYCFLYTLSGSGNITYKKDEGELQVFSLAPSSLIFFDCRQPFTLESVSAPWKFKILFAGGGNLPFYMASSGKSLGCLLENATGCELLHNLNLLYQGSLEDEMLYKLQDEKNMTCFCITFLSEFLKNKNSSPKTPKYLLEMKQLFDTRYEHNYSLDELEHFLGISKYRLCREFSSYFGESPIQYLNRIRISNSKLLLQGTDLKVHEVGAKVGIENTNHFIQLFKRQEGTTPLTYRETRLLS